MVLIDHGFKLDNYFSVMTLTRSPRLNTPVRKGKGFEDINTSNGPTHIDGPVRREVHYNKLVCSYKHICFTLLSVGMACQPHAEKY